MSNRWLDRKKPDQKLSTNFVAAEFFCKCGGCTPFISTEAVATLQRLREAWGKALTLTSAYRCPEYNKKVGGSKKSYHQLGVAFDVPWPTKSVERRREFVKLARDAGFKGFGYYKTFLHVDIGPARSWNRKDAP